MDDLEHFPWPKKGESLFAEGEDWWNNACLDIRPGCVGGMIASGYFRAAESLANQVIESRCERESLFFPIAFCYRHYMELCLKDLFLQAKALTDTSLTKSERESLNKEHDVFYFWSRFRPMLEQIAPNEDKAVLAAVEENLRELQALDPKSQSFRYAKDTKGGVPLAGIGRISIRILRDTMKGMSAFLDGVDSMLSEYLGYKADMETEYRSEMESAIGDWLY